MLVDEGVGQSRGELEAEDAVGQTDGQRRKLPVGIAA